MSVLPDKSSQSGTQVIWSRRVSVGVIGGNAGVGFLQGDKVGTQPDLFLPMVKQNAHTAFFGQPVKPAGLKAEFNRKAPVFQTQGRTPERSAGIAVYKRQHAFVIPDQRVDISLIAHKPQRIVGGDPAASGGGAGTKTVAPLILGNRRLIINQIRMISFQRDLQQ